MSDQLYLYTYLEPLKDLLERNDITDIFINRPQEVWIETINGDIEVISKPNLTETNLLLLSRQIAAISSQGINRENPLLSASLPDGSRVQIIIPPAVRSNCAIAIRKHTVSNLTLSNYFPPDIDVNSTSFALEADIKIRSALEESDFKTLLDIAVKARKTILISGGTSTGKTTFLNTLIKEIPKDERLIYIEDTPELLMHHNNIIGLIAPRNNLGEALVTANDLLSASLRMRPDRIILGELRGPEAFTFLRAINTGHPGSMTTVHADSPSQAIEQIALLVMQTGTNLSRSDIKEYIAQTIDIYLQLERKNGQRRVRDVLLKADLDNIS